MASKNPGYYIKTLKGNTGYTIHTDNLVNGKVIVYLIEGINFKPLLNENGKHKKILCNSSEFKIIGFKD